MSDGDYGCMASGDGQLEEYAGDGEGGVYYEAGARRRCPRQR